MESAWKPAFFTRRAACANFSIIALISATGSFWATANTGSTGGVYFPSKNNRVGGLTPDLLTNCRVLCQPVPAKKSCAASKDGHCSRA